MTPLHATVTLTVTQRVYIYTEARCPHRRENGSYCNQKLCDVPGSVTIEVRHVKDSTERAGRGHVISCERCHRLNEVIVHGR